ncbi:MAG: hypothetical protein LBN95_00160 [Prevotellaceae bacterium]|jgi:hypothetical protein|nr:hypothetical protein [Prevotellaceae bacterium]
MEKEDINQIYENISQVLPPEKIFALREDIIAEHEAEKASQPQPPDDTGTAENLANKTDVQTVENAISADNSDSKINVEITPKQAFDDLISDSKTPKQSAKKGKSKSAKNAQDENVLVTFARKHYDKKAKKQKNKIFAIDRQINSVHSEKKQCETQLSGILSQIDECKQQIIGLINANNFLEIQENIGILSKFLNLAKHDNNRKIFHIEQQIENLLIKGKKVRNRLDELDRNSEFLAENAKNKQADLAIITAKINNLGTSNVFANPFAAILLNAKTNLSDLEKYYYREISEEQIKEIDGLQYDIKQTKNAFIIR